MTTNGKLQEEIDYTYCPDCGLLMKVKDSDDINSVEHCDLCHRNYRPRF
ncbi:MAG: hypothetical protein ACTSSB_14890 [Candidatus Heimdallarchaeota archaeon]